MAKKKDTSNTPATVPAPASNVVELHDYAERLPKELRGTISSAGSFFGWYGSTSRFAPIPYNPDSLVRKKGIKVYREMAQDEQVKAALLCKQYAVLSSGYEIQLPDVDEEDQDEEVSDEHKKFIEFCFGEMKGSFESKLLDIMSSVTYGFSVSERIIKSIDYGPFEGKWGLMDLKTRPPDDIEFGMDAVGNLTEDGVIQNGIKMPTAKFVIHSYRQQWGNPYGDSDLRAAYRPWWAKDSMLKLMAVSLERYAEPIAVATYKGLLDTNQRTDLEGFLKNLQSRSGILIPETVTLEFKAPPPRAAEAFIPSINLYDQHLRIAILMPGLIGLSGEQQAGSFARAVKEFDVFLWIIGQLRRDLETLVNEQIIKPLLDLNFEIAHGEYPTFRFKEITESARQQQYELFLAGLGAGALTKGPEDENKLRELINFQPLPEDFVPPNPMDQFGGGFGVDQFGGGFNGGAEEGYDGAATGIPGEEPVAYSNDQKVLTYEEEQELVTAIERITRGK